MANRPNLLLKSRGEIRMSERIKLFTTFSGIGSQEMALRNIKSNFEVVAISEVDRYALIGYDSIFNQQASIIEEDKGTMLKYFKDLNIAYNFSTNKSEVPRSLKDITTLYEASIRSKNLGDIRRINEDKLPEFNLFTYSFPCKNISVAGSQAGLEEGSDTQSSLLWECERLIKAGKPKVLLMENVKNLVSRNHKPQLDLWIEKLNKLGYTSYWKVLNAWDFSLAQNRERVMMVSVLNDDKKSFKFPEPRECIQILKDILEHSVEEKYYIPRHRWEHLNLKELPYQDKAYCIDAHYHKGTSVERFIRQRKRHLIQVGNLDKKTHANTRVYSSEGLSPTLNSMNGGNRQPKVAYLEGIRRLTPLECWRLMGYSDEDFNTAKSAGLSNTKLYERAGRGIAVTMLEDLFSNIVDYAFK